MLTEIAIRRAKPADQPRKLRDTGNLYLLLKPDGRRYWRLDYRFAGKRKTLALGVYPAVSLVDARARRDEAKKQLDAGIDPGAQRKAEKLARIVSDATAFKAVALEWLEGRDLAETTRAKTRRMLDVFVFPWIGHRPIGEIEPAELLGVLRRPESQDKLETTQRLKQICGQVFRYGVATGRAKRDPAADLRGALRTRKNRHHASITDPAKVGELLRSIDGYSGQFITQCALRLAPLVFVRPGELRHAEWSEIDLDGALWRIPAARMKMRADHLVPLSTQAIQALRELQPLTGRGRYLFPSIRSASDPMSENTVNAALRRLGYDKDTMTGHGFRTMASTLLHEQGWNTDAIERQLAHAERNAIKAAYNRAEHLPERRRMMQAWADYLDGLRAGADVIPLRRAV